MAMIACRNSFWLLVLLLTISVLAIGQEVAQLQITKEDRLPEAVYKQVAMGGPRDTIKCGPDKSLWFPALRGYSETVSSLVKYSTHKALKIDIDGFPQLTRGSIEYFSPTVDGGAIALVRSVKEYSQVDGIDDKPKKYGDSFAVKFSPDLERWSIVRLAVDQAAQPALDQSGLAELPNGWMLVGSSSDGARVRVTSLLFDHSGKFRSELHLPDGATKEDQVPKAGLGRPTVVSASDGTFLILFKLSGQPVYRISKDGKLLGTVRLSPAELYFWSPRIDDNHLFVKAEVSPVKLGQLGSVPIERGRSAFALFDLRTGTLSDVFTFDGDYAGEVGCYQNEGVPRLTVIHQGFDRETGKTFWSIRVLEPVKKTEPLTPS